jgi:hypothetical protein
MTIKRRPMAIELHPKSMKHCGKVLNEQKQGLMAEKVKHNCPFSLANRHLGRKYGFKAILTATMPVHGFMCAEEKRRQIILKKF